MGAPKISLEEAEGKATQWELDILRDFFFFLYITSTDRNMAVPNRWTVVTGGNFVPSMGSHNTSEDVQDSEAIAFP